MQMIDESYLTHVLALAKARSERGGDCNGSSLKTKNDAKLEEIIRAKLEGCVLQKTTRNVKYLRNGTDLSLSAMIDLAWAEVATKMSDLSTLARPSTWSLIISTMIIRQLGSIQ